MDRKNSSGRKKRYTSGGGNAFRRGSGTGTGPVGKKDTYSVRKQRVTGSSSGSGSSSQSGSRSVLSGLFGSSSGKKSSVLKTIIIILVIVVVGYFIIRSCGNDQESADNLSGNDLSSNVTESSSILSSLDSTSPSLNSSVSTDARDKRTKILGNGEDVFTIMVYMCGSDLESKHGMATADLKEMINADISENVNIIIETGGATDWKNSTVSSSTNQRFKLVDDGLITLEENLGRKTMTDSGTLSDFIKYAKQNFPANRYALIFWDHGAGSLSGYGYDEFAPGNTMTLSEINTALDTAGCTFDFIGFDACLMATFETAITLERYSDYMIASEEIEPGIGWYYTDWLTALSKDTSMSTLNIGKNIIDSFIEVCYQNSSKDKTTLSLIDLAELKGTVPSAFKEFSKSTSELIDSDQYKIVSDARSGAKSFGVPSVDNQVDLIHFASSIGTQEAAELVSTLSECIKYNRTSSNISNSYGLSIYFPYGKLQTLTPMLSTYEDIGFDEEYGDCIKSFANLEAGGQIVSSGSSSPFNSLLGQFTGSTGTDMISGLLDNFLGGSDYSSLIGDVAGNALSGWLDPDKIKANQSYYEENYLDSSDLMFEDKDGTLVLSLTDDQWDIIQNLQLNVFLDDGEGYIDLGLDNVYEFDDDGDLVMDFDGTWIALNGQIVSYYFVSEDNGTITGRVPAMLNGQLVDIILVFDDEDPYGKIIGSQMVYEETDIAAKGLMELKDGDVIDFLCDYYSYDEKYTDSYYLGNQMIVDGEIMISNVPLGEYSVKASYMLTDIYNNNYWTESIDF